ncbi:MAG: type IX secretion system membrane protein PorP/SprF [Bacteroidales bacterium]|nr:type IX secretion system membrane protein PorP/SprF [Bacteroidales bacterium]MDD3860177.1 type IX secretion system membrane protein PorP/SprF [Bacteroidales bacterium]
MKKTYTILIALLFGTSLFAQQNFITNQYIFNPMTINPAYAGTKQWTSINMLYSAPWSGLEGAPNTQSFSIEGSPISTMGLGLQLINDRIGAESRQSLWANYSYILKLNKKLNLSMGLAAGVSYFSLDGRKLISESIDDPSVPLNRVNSIRFDPKMGIFLYSERFYTGLSVTDMLGNLIESPDGFVSKQERHYYLTAGYVFDLGEDVKAKPSILIREDFKAPTNIDVTTHFLIKKTFWIGATYRFGANFFTSQSLDNTLRKRDALIVMTQFNINPSWVIGYSYTHSLTALSSFAGHEIMLDYTLPRKVETRMKTPRYF